MRRYEVEQVSKATRRVNLRTDFHKPLLKLIMKKDVTSSNIVQIEEEVEFMIFKLDRDLQKNSFQIFVKGSKTTVIDIDSCTTVAQLKKMLQVSLTIV